MKKTANAFLDDHAERMHTPSRSPMSFQTMTVVMLLPLVDRTFNPDRSTDVTRDFIAYPMGTSGRAQHVPTTGSIDRGNP